MNIVSSLLVSSKCTERMQVKICCTNHIKPTGNLDTQNSREVIALMKKASKKYQQTILMITHNRSIAQTADRVLQVSDGILTDFGRCGE